MACLGNREQSLLFPLIVGSTLLLACGGEVDPGASGADVGGGLGDASGAAVDGGMAAEDGEGRADDEALEAGSVTPEVAEGPGDRLDPRRYCERSAVVFCPYYLRCGRMAVDSLEACLVAFDEVCNAVYEPIYAGLADRDLLALSAAGLEKCAQHLETVACEAQVFDLDLGCREVWLGQVAAGGACGPGIESFVCDADSTCVVGLSFCGACEAAASTGGICGGGVRCHPYDACVEGRCQSRPVGGESCDEAVACALGTTCVAGTCVGDRVVAVGEACGQGAGCPYKSQCLGGVCVAAGLAGDACAPGIPCASGTCKGGLCVAVKPAGESCGAGPECHSGRCEGGLCAPDLGGCTGS